jgi:two-component system, response regulator PdtaR
MDAHATVLIVDEGRVRDELGAVLGQAGFAVILCADPGEVLATLDARGDVRVLVTDMDVCGLDLAREAHARRPGLGLVITSGRTRWLNPAEIPGDGCFLPRPLPVHTLVGEVASAASRGT